MQVEVTNEQLERIIPAGIDFIRTITQELGAEKGMEFWEELSRCLGDDVKGRIFFEMITGNESGTKVTFGGVKQLYCTGGYKIHGIKCIRNACNLGLKEAKDIMDALEAGHAQTMHVVDWRKRGAFVNEMRGFGVYTA